MGPYNSRGGSSRGRGGFHGGRQSGPRLPSALLAEVDVGGSGGNRNKGRPRGAAPRPQQQGSRGEEVRESLHRYNNAQKPRAAVPEQQIPRPTKSKKRRPQVEVQDEEPPKKKKKKELTLPGKKSGDAEDGEIEWLEYMLRKEKGKEDDELTDDGLDDLLSFADVIGPGGQGLEVDDDDDEDIDLSSGDDTDDGNEGESSEADDASGYSEEGSSDGSEIDDQGSDQDGIDTDEEDDAEEVSDPLQTDQVIPNVPPAVPAIPATPSDLIPAAEASTSSARYIPPHLRAAQLEAKSRGDKEKEQERIKLERKAQGLLNKLSEANIETILGEIEGLYRDNSRNDVSTILTDLVIQTIADRSNLLDSFVVLYATLVGALHRIIGLEFGAHFVHTLISKYRALSGATNMSADTPLPATLYETPDASKSPLNLLTLIAELYNAQIVGANLIYDLIRSFLTEAAADGAVMAEGQVESLLRLLKCSGQQLRSDDPASLKDIVNLVQEKTKGKEKTMTTRARYMTETLVDLKGGKSKSSQNTDQDAAMRMKKFLNSLGRKRRVATTEPLRVSLQDLLNADSRGKWWLVGAGWSGNPLVEREQAFTKVPKKTAQPAVEDEEVLLEAARRQGMNTDVRRSIFVILMTSEDFIHACDRLSHLKFTEVQQREFVRVTLHCCTTEKTYNPYHTLILNKLCAESYSHRFTFQYALWDFLRELGDESGKSPKVRCGNVGKAAAYVVARGSLDLTVFKAVDFTLLKSSGIYFFSVFLTRLILATQTSSPLFTLPKAFKVQDLDTEVIEETFEKALSNLQLAQGLMWVIGRKGAIEKGTEDLGDLAKAVASRGMKLATRVLGRAV